MYIMPLLQSTTVTRYHCAVYVWVSLTDEVHQATGVSSLLGGAGPTVAANHLWERHCRQQQSKALIESSLSTEQNDRVKNFRETYETDQILNLQQ